MSARGPEQHRVWCNALCVSRHRPYIMHGIMCCKIHTRVHTVLEHTRTRLSLPAGRRCCWARVPLRVRPSGSTVCLVSVGRGCPSPVLACTCTCLPACLRADAAHVKWVPSLSRRRPGFHEAPGLNCQAHGPTESVSQRSGSCRSGFGHAGTKKGTLGVFGEVGRLARSSISTEVLYISTTVLLPGEAKGRACLGLSFKWTPLCVLWLEAT